MGENIYVLLLCQIAMIYSTVLSSTVTIIYLRSLDFIHLKTESLDPLTNLSLFLPYSSPRQPLFYSLILWVWLLLSDYYFFRFHAWVILYSIMYKQYPTVFLFLCLACFVQRNAFKVRPHCSKWQDVFLSPGWVYPIKCIHHILSTHLLMDTWLVSTSSLLWTRLSRTRVCRHLSDILLSIWGPKLNVTACDGNSLPPRAQSQLVVSSDTESKHIIQQCLVSKLCDHFLIIWRQRIPEPESYFLHGYPGSPQEDTLISQHLGSPVQSLQK